MILGLIQYKMGDQYLGDAGYLKTGESPEQVAVKARKFVVWFLGSMAAIALFVPARVVVGIGDLDDALDTPGRAAGAGGIRGAASLGARLVSASSGGTSR